MNHEIGRCRCKVEYSKDSSEGLWFNTDGAALLSRVTTSGNGTYGINGSAIGSITLMCAVVMDNGNSGYTLNGASITIKGLFSYGNLFADSATPAAVITYPCALP